MVADFARVRVVAVRDGLPGPEVWLVLRRNLETGELKTYVCNAPVGTPLQTLVRLSGMRWPIETCFEEGKQYLDMGQYEVRSWRGWYHHMTKPRQHIRLQSMDRSLHPPLLQNRACGFARTRLLNGG